MKGPTRTCCTVQGLARRSELKRQQGRRRLQDANGRSKQTLSARSNGRHQVDTPGEWQAQAPPVEFPLFYESHERTRFAYAIFLLNKVS